MNTQTETNVDWSKPSQAFRHFDGRLPDWPEPQAEYRKYTASDVRWNREQGFKLGIVVASAMFTIGVVAAEIVVHVLWP